MPLVNPLPMLRDASQNGYAVGALNFVDYLTAETIVEAAEDRRSPVILQTSSGTIKRFGVKTLVGMARLVAEQSTVPVTLHLDHGKDRAVLSEAIQAGYDSVMIDGSHLPFDENVRLTKDVVEEAHAKGVAVEGEIGVVAGVEDDIVVNQDAAIYTTPDEAVEFQRQTGIDFLAPAIGTAHGFYKVKPRLDIGTLAAIHQVADYPLVVHGGTGLPFDVVRELTRSGGAKFNVSTQIKQTYIDGLFEYIEANRTEYHPLRLLEEARKRLVAMIAEYMDVLGSSGKAP